MRIQRKKDSWYIQHNGQIPEQLHRQLLQFATKTAKFRAPTPAEVQMFKRKMAELRFPYKNFMSFRGQAIRNFIMGNYNKINKIIAKIAAEYTAGDGIVTLAKRYIHPPLDLLRMIFAQLGYKNVNSIIKGETQLTSPRDIEEYKNARMNDITLSDTLDKSLKYEMQLAQKFNKAGIKYKTQDDLVKEQRQLGSPVLTPDFLFISPVYINGTRVFWLDAKDYYYIPGFMTKKLQTQGEKYNAKWGPGAFIFHYGYSIPVPGIICI